MPSSKTHLGGAGLDVGRSLHSQPAAGLRFGRRCTRSWHSESQMEGAVKRVEFPISGPWDCFGGFHCFTTACIEKALATKDQGWLMVTGDFVTLHVLIMMGTPSPTIARDFSFVVWHCSAVLRLLFFSEVRANHGNLFFSHFIFLPHQVAGKGRTRIAVMTNCFCGLYSYHFWPSWNRLKLPTILALLLPVCTTNIFPVGLFQKRFKKVWSQKWINSAHVAGLLHGWFFLI